LRQVAVVVEGQTEEGFVADVLGPHLLNDDIHVQPIVVATSRAANGSKFKGGGGWSHYARDLTRLLSEPHWTVVTTMIDFYAYPADGPGAGCPTPHVPRTCVALRQAAMATVFTDPRFLPFVMLHEFETLVFASALGRSTVLDSPALAAGLQAEAAAFGNDVELINDSPTTAPSKRIQRIWPEYSKSTDGVAATAEVGVPALEGPCPHFAAWLEDMRTR
jgi:hypothetical protein